MVGLKIAKEGKDINSADPRDFSLNTDYALFKIDEEFRYQPLTPGQELNIISDSWFLLFAQDATTLEWGLADCEYVRDLGGDTYWWYMNDDISDEYITYFLMVDTIF